VFVFIADVSYEVRTTTCVFGDPHALVYVGANVGACLTTSAARDVWMSYMCNLSAGYDPPFQQNTSLVGEPRNSILLHEMCVRLDGLRSVPCESPFHHRHIFTVSGQLRHGRRHLRADNGKGTPPRHHPPSPHLSRPWTGATVVCVGAHMIHLDVDVCIARSAHAGRRQRAACWTWSRRLCRRAARIYRVYVHQVMHLLKKTLFSLDLFSWAPVNSTNTSFFWRFNKKVWCFGS
jgi:hypothetical protein